ncbi:MAG TPA: nucleotide disphospho-sugar-binding domain-containing protein [Acidimicrobiales bacterium]|nr:nucleotide disphospho-sugar-binding domain-containing protein [Acidimicrobiales bacterium]
MRVLCTCLPGHGHFNPMLALAQGLSRAGHEVAFATAEDFCPHVEKTGFAAFPAGMALARQMEEARRHYPEQDALGAMERFEQFVPRMLAGVAAPARAADLIPLVDHWKPDLLVHDETEFAGPVAAAMAGIPWADQSVGILRPLGMARLAGETLAPLCREHGVDVGPFGGLFRYLYIDVAPPSLQSAEIDEVPVAHPVQNATIDPGAEGDRLPDWVDDLPHDRPVVYVSLGTVFNARAGDVFAAVLQALRDEPLTAILTVGHDNDPDSFGPQPDHVHVERFIPQSLLLPHCDAVVNQGGTAILPILAHGLPLLLLPQGANQFHNAAACVAAGVGRRLLPAEVSPDAVRREVRALLDDRRLRDAARRVQEELAAMPGPERGVALLERLAAERRPLMRA